jgi:hypothetical protein
VSECLVHILPMSYCSLSLTDRYSKLLLMALRASVRIEGALLLPKSRQCVEFDTYSLGLILKTQAQKIFHIDVVAISTVYEADRVTGKTELQLN